MKFRNAFTMIEVVFVIIVIGILAAVALPRMGKTVEDARTAKIQWFVDTLNRTVSPVLWSGLLCKFPDAHGSVKSSVVAGHPEYTSIYDKFSATAEKAKAHFEEIPSTLTTNADGVTGAGSLHDIPLSGCADTGTPIAPGVGRIASAKIGNVVYNIGCIDGNDAISPHFFLDDGSRIITK
jgi:general secretion pathway protein G